MADDLADVYKELRELKEQVRVLMSANPLQASSVSQGRVRFIGGLLRVDSGGSVQIVGTLEIDGTTTVTGTFTVTGPWNLEGNGTITGAVTITGNVTSTGTLTQNGPWIFNGAGDITGDVDLTGILSVLGGGRIKVGSSMTLNPAGSNGRIEFANGAQVFTNGSTIQVFKGNSVVEVSDGYAQLQNGGNVIEISPSGARISPGAIATLAGTGLPVGTLSVDGSGYLRRAV